MFIIPGLRSGEESSFCSWHLVSYSLARSREETLDFVLEDDSGEAGGGRLGDF